MDRSNTAAETMTGVRIFAGPEPDEDPLGIDNAGRRRPGPAAVVLCRMIEGVLQVNAATTLSTAVVSLSGELLSVERRHDRVTAPTSPWPAAM